MIWGYMGRAERSQSIWVKAFGQAAVAGLAIVGVLVGLVIIRQLPRCPQNAPGDLGERVRCDFVLTVLTCSGPGSQSPSWTACAARPARCCSWPRACTRKERVSRGSLSSGVPCGVRGLIDHPGTPGSCKSASLQVCAHICAQLLRSRS